MRKTLLLLLAGVLIVLMTASVSFAASDQTVNGWVSDSKCGVKGANANAAECKRSALKRAPVP